MLAYEIGLTTEQFWASTPVEFNLMVQAYHRRTRNDGVYFREMYTLHYNQWQAEHAKNPSFLEPGDVLKLPTDELPKIRKQRKGDFEKVNGWTQAEMLEAVARINRQGIRERNIAKQHEAELQAQSKMVKAERAVAIATGRQPRVGRTHIIGKLMLEIYEENPPMGPLIRMGPLTKEEFDAGTYPMEESAEPKTIP